MAAFPNISSVVTAIQTAAHPWMATLDVKDTFFMMPLREEYKAQFTFTWKGKKYTFNNLSQRYKHSSTISHNALAAFIDTVKVPFVICIYQYIDDILVSNQTIRNRLGK